MNYVRNTRLDQLEKLSWKTSKTLPEHFEDKVSPLELKYFQDYISLIEKYTSSLQYGKLHLSVVSLIRLNLMNSQDLEPPKDLFVEVRILKDCGEVELEETGKQTFVLNHELCGRHC